MLPLRVPRRLLTFALACAGAIGQDFAAEVAAARALVPKPNGLAASRQRLSELGAIAADDDQRQLVADMLGEVGDLARRVSRFTEAHAAWADALALQLRIHGEADHDGVAQCHQHLAMVARDRSDFPTALALYRAERDMRRRLAGELDDELLANACNSVAFCLANLGRKREALADYEAAVAMLRRIGRRGKYDYLPGFLDNLAACQQALDSFPEAMANYDEALRLKRETQGDESLAVAGGLNRVAFCMRAMGRPVEALPRFEAAFALYERLLQGRDDAECAGCETNLALCLQDLGRAQEALPHYEAVLGCFQRLFPGQDNPHIAGALNNVGYCLDELGRLPEAERVLLECLNMQERLHGGRDGPGLALALNNVGRCLEQAARYSEAADRYASAAAMQARLVGGSENSSVAGYLHNVGVALVLAGRPCEAEPKLRASLATFQRLRGGTDTAVVARGLAALGFCLEEQGRSGDALPQLQIALAMNDRIFAGHDHPSTARILNDLANSLASLGRRQEALVEYEAGRDMYRRLYPEGHPDLCRAMVNTAGTQVEMGNAAAGRAELEAALHMMERLHQGQDHPDLVSTRLELAACEAAAGRMQAARSTGEEALAMSQRLFPDTDNPLVAHALYDTGVVLSETGMALEALPRLQAALAMRQRLHGDADHPDLISSASGLTTCLIRLGRDAEALAVAEAGARRLERLLASAHTLSAALRNTLWDELKKRWLFEHLQMLQIRAGKPEEALATAERSRSRGLLDLLEQARFDPFEEAQRRAAQRGDADGAARLTALAGELASLRMEHDRLLAEASRPPQLTAEPAAAAAEGVPSRLRRNLERTRQLQDERARLCADCVPFGSPRSCGEIRNALEAGELLIEFTVTPKATYVFCVTKDGGPEVLQLPFGEESLAVELTKMLPALARESGTDARGRNPGSEGEAPRRADAAVAAQRLFEGLFPAELWRRVLQARRVWIAAHRGLHRLPFEALVVGHRDGAPVRWLESGPPVAYVPSGSVLVWLRERARDQKDDATALDLLAVGDPRDSDSPREPPEHGALVVTVGPNTEAARTGMQPGDVLVGYAGSELIDDAMLRELLSRVSAQTEDGERAGDVALRVWRQGATIDLQVHPGPLGVRIGRGPARKAWLAAQSPEAQLEIVTRAGDLERLGKLPPLGGARDEVKAIAALFADGTRIRTLLGEEATKTAVFELAAKAKMVHFACHGIAEEYGGESLSMLVLGRPGTLPGATGFLTLSDLLGEWRSRLSSTNCVVLSACRTNVGPSFRDDAPQALPIGFLFAGAASVVSSLWAVDDTSTAALMAGYYRRVLGGEHDRLRALTEAKKELLRQFPDPYHWAPFLYMGSPR